MKSGEVSNIIYFAFTLAILFENDNLHNHKKLSTQTHYRNEMWEGEYGLGLIYNKQNINRVFCFSLRCRIKD